MSIINLLKKFYFTKEFSRLTRLWFNVFVYNSVLALPTKFFPNRLIVRGVGSVALLCFFYFNSCLRIRVEEMKPNLVTRIKIGEDISKIQIEKHGYVFMNLPFKVPLNTDRVYVLDYKNSLIKVFLKNGDLDFIIGTPKQNVEHQKIIPIQLNQLGHIAVNDANEIFVQSFPLVKVEQKVEPVDPFNSLSGTFHYEEPKVLPSYILYIPSNNKQMEVYGISGKNSEPFEFIENLYSGDKEKFFVVHRLSENLVLSYFFKGKLKGRIEENNLLLFFTEESTKYKIQLESILPDRSGSYALAMFTFLDKEDGRFKFRRIYRYKYNDPKPETLLKEFQNPTEILFGNKQSREFITLETEDSGSSLRLLIHDSLGNHIANKRIRLDSPRERWRELYQDFNDSFYSLKLSAGYLEIYEWK